MPLNIHAVALGLFMALATCNATAGPLTVHEYKRPAEMTGKPPAQRVDGWVTLGDGSKVPSYAVRFQNPVEDDGFDDRSVAGQSVSYVPKDGLGAQLEAYPTSTSVILVPKGWAVRTAAMGVNGSEVVLFEPRDKSGSYLVFRGDGACVGCALGNASAFFDAAAKRSKKEGFEPRTLSKAFRVVSIGTGFRAYSVNAAGDLAINGLAHYEGSGHPDFYSVEIAVPKSQQHLATAVLNQFLHR